MKVLFVDADEGLIQELFIVLERNSLRGTGSMVQIIESASSDDVFARLRGLLNTPICADITSVELGEFRLKLASKEVWQAGNVLDLTPKEYAILSRLMLEKGKPVHRDRLLQEITHWAMEPATNTLEVHIHNLREKIGKPYIKTLRGFGYSLVINEK